MERKADESVFALIFKAHHTTEERGGTRGLRSVDSCFGITLLRLSPRNRHPAPHRR
ncbi:hypothetical protein HMPREF9440_00341 [Sutterella parvirubra YIT 11816]|uniref:Uncharacterized protein n=1 Tax=Sutterella parvirubra YIT 11816 TaxID=762967 RepID=H3KC91_9BURK|nr:hypothetical protein HMPREF9440_00341 [Sutterella parvirubra YIT 11816]